MARFHITNERSYHSKATGVCRSAGLEEQGTYTTPEYWLRTYNKRAQNTTNFVDFGNGDWISAVGSLIYNGRLGDSALREFYKEYKSCSIPDIQFNAIGHYAVAIKSGNSIEIFTDPQGTLSLYYATTNSSWIVSNSLYTLASGLDTTSVDPLELLALTFEYSEIGTKTLFSEVNRLFGSQYIKIDLITNSFSVQRVTNRTNLNKFNFGSIEAAINQYQSEVETIFSQITNAGSIGLTTTGGLDSRTNLSALLAQEVRPQIIYGVGNSGLTNTKKSDMDIAKKLADKFDLLFYEMDWSGSHPNSREKIIDKVKKFGFNSEVYGSPDSFISELDGQMEPYPKIMLSGHSPAFTNAKPWETEKDQFDIKYLIEQKSHKPSNIRLGEKYDQRIKESILEAIKIGTDIDCPQTLNYEQFLEARLFIYLRPEARGINFANEFTHYIAPFIQKRLYDPIIHIPRKWRKNNRFQIMLIDHLCSEVLDVPIYSGLKPSKIDKSNYEMKRPMSYQVKHWAISSLRQISGKVLPPLLKEPARELDAYFSADPTDDLHIDRKIRNKYTTQVQNDEWFSSNLRNIDMSGLNLSQLTRLNHYLAGIQTLKLK